MKLYKKIGVVSLIAASLSYSATAVDAGIVFAGAILETCVVTVGTAGTLVASGDLTNLSSENSGGIKGTASVVTNGVNSSVQVIAPTSFLTGPSTADTNTTFATDYALTGATITAELAGTVTTSLNLGITTVSVDATATKSSGTFDAGAYSLVSTVRCTTT